MPDENTTPAEPVRANAEIPIRITVDAPHLTLDSVIQSHLLGEDEHGQEHWSSTTLREMIMAQLIEDAKTKPSWGSVDARIREIRDEEIRTAVKVQVEEALAQPYQPSNRYGEKKGQTRTLREDINDQVQKVLKGEDGRAGGYERDQPLLKRLVNEQITYQLQSEMSKALDEVKKDLLMKFRAQASAVLVEALKGVVR
jgi:hypothetical protein